MDPLLLPFLRSTDGPEREELLADLLLVHAAPIVRYTLWQRLKFHLSPAGVNPHNPDAEDLYQDVMAKIAGRLSFIRARPEERAIEDFRAYVSGVAINACHDYRRERAPRRTHLRDHLQDTLERHRDFEVWRTGEGLRLCGFTTRGGNRGCAPAQSLYPLTENPELLTGKFPRTDVRSVPLARLAAAVLEWAGGPVELEELVDLLAKVLRVDDRTDRPLAVEASYPNQEDPSARPDGPLERCEAFARIWEEIKRLPPREREAVCLLANDERGDDLIGALIDAGVASFYDLAEALNFPFERVIKLWWRMPLTREGLAAELGTTREKLNLRYHRGLKRLRERMTRAPEKNKKRTDAIAGLVSRLL
jgi:RNA polymerase sigma factor (sigma-70 family)